MPSPQKSFNAIAPLKMRLVLSICCGRCLKRKRLAMAGQHWSHRASPKRLYRGSLAANQFCGVAGVRLWHGHYSSGAGTFVKEKLQFCGAFVPVVVFTTAAGDPRRSWENVYVVFLNVVKTEKAADFQCRSRRDPFAELSCCCCWRISVSQ